MKIMIFQCLHNKQIFFDYIPIWWSEDELIPFFSSYGKVEELELMTDVCGQSLGYGVLTYENGTHCEPAIRLMNRLELVPGERPLLAVYFE